eukprot:evm.model.scf_704.2 EVM.evm.TU.scf_704.2   scf_704:33173-34663(-)
MGSPAAGSRAELSSPWDGHPRPAFGVGDAEQRFGQLSIGDHHPPGCLPRGWPAGARGQEPLPAFDGPSLFEHGPPGGGEAMDVVGGGCAAHQQPHRRLYPQSSMVARLAEDKDFVDPKDVPQLLPTELLDSKSLDLAGILNSMEESGEIPPEFAAPKTPSVEDPVCYRPASQHDRPPPPANPPRIPRADGSVREVRPGVIGTRSAPSYKALQAQYADHAAHNRSSSEPVYAGEALAAVPVLALVPASRLPAVSAAFPPLGAQLWADCQKRHRKKAAKSKPGRKGPSPCAGVSPTEAEWENGRGRGGATPETPGSSVGDGSRGSSRGRRKGGKKAVKQPSAEAPQPQIGRPPAKKGAPGGAKVSGTGAGTGIKLGSRKSVSKGEVKRLVRYQVWVGRPIRTPWYREKPRGMKREGEGDEDSEEEEEENEEENGPRTPKTPTPREHPKPPIRPRIVTGPSGGGPAQPGIQVGYGASPSSPDVKGTGFFCPRGQTAPRK